MRSLPLNVNTSLVFPYVLIKRISVKDEWRSPLQHWCPSLKHAAFCIALAQWGPGLLWAQISTTGGPSTRTAGSPDFSWWKNRLPGGLELMGWCTAGVWMQHSQWKLWLGWQLQGRMLSLEVSLWSLPAFVGRKKGVWISAFSRMAATSAQGLPSPAALCLCRSWQAGVNWWLTSTAVSETLAWFCCSCMFFSLQLLDVVFSPKRGYCVHIKQRLKIESTHFWKKSAYDAEQCAR